MPTFTKLYLTNVAAPYTPATLRGAWDDTASAVTKALSPRKEFGGSIASVSRSETDASANFDVLLYRGISGALAAQTLSGNLDVVIGVQESGGSADFAFHVHAYVTQGSSDTPRGTLIADYVETTGNEWPTTQAGKALASPQAYSLAVSAGDRIVVELGFISLNATATVFTGTARYGVASADGLTFSDLTAGSTSTGSRAGFVSFSNPVTEDAVTARITRSSVSVLVSLALPSVAVPVLMHHYREQGQA